MRDVTRLSLLDSIRTSNSNERWSEFALEYGKMLSKWLMAQSFKAQDAEDLQQEVMAVVVEQIPQFEHNGRTGAFRAWLRQIMVNRIRQFRDRKRGEKFMPNLDALADQLTDEKSRLSIQWEHEHNSHLIGQLLTRAQAKFNEQAIAIFHELTIKEVPGAEVAQKYGMSLGTVRVQQHRVLGYIRQLGGGMVDI